jgi:hypothetical protein
VATSRENVRASSSTDGFVALEIRLELGIVVRDDLFGDAHVQVVLLGLGRCGEALFVVVPGVVVDQCLLAEHIGDGVEVLLLPQRQLERPEMGAEHGAEICQHARKSARARSSCVTTTMRGTPASTAADHTARVPGDDAVHRAHHDHRDIRDGERGVDAADEIRVARGVDERDPAIGPRPPRSSSGTRARCRGVV